MWEMDPQWVCWSDRVVLMSSTYFYCRKLEENTGEAVDQKVKLCEAVGAVKELTYLGLSACDDGCEPSLTNRTRRG